MLGPHTYWKAFNFDSDLAQKSIKSFLLFTASSSAILEFFHTHVHLFVLKISNLPIFSILGWSRVFFSSAFLYFIVLNLFDKHFSSFLISKAGYLFYNAFFYFIIINLFDKHFSSILISKAGYLFVLPFYLRLLKISSAAYSRQSAIKDSPNKVEDICMKMHTCSHSRFCNFS